MPTDDGAGAKGTSEGGASLRLPSTPGAGWTLAAFVMALGLLVSTATACGTSATGPTDPTAFLKSARDAFDSAPAMHFMLTYQGPTPKGLSLTGGTGDFERPDKFQGTLDVLYNGLPLQVKAIAVSDSLFIELPFQSNYSQTNPAQYGVGNPSHLISPTSGVSRLLTSAISPHFSGTERYRGELLTEVSASLPGPLVAALLTSKDPSRPVSAVFAIDPSSDQVRIATLTGPFYFADRNSTFHLVLDDYGEQISIRAP
jgi:hypothetical protein